MSVSAAEQGEWDVEKELALHHGRWIQDEVDKPIRYAQIAVGIAIVLQIGVNFFIQSTLEESLSVQTWVSHLSYLGIIGMLAFMLLNRTRTVAVLLVGAIVGMGIWSVMNGNTGSLGFVQLLLIAMTSRAAFGCFKYQSLKKGLMLTMD